MYSVNHESKQPRYIQIMKRNMDRPTKKQNKSIWLAQIEIDELPQYVTQ